MAKEYLKDAVLFDNEHAHKIDKHCEQASFDG